MPRHQVNRLRRLLAGASFLAAVTAACGGASANGDGIVVKLVTPVVDASPTLEPGVSPTPVAPPELVLSTFEVYQSGAVLVSVTGEITGGTANFLGRNYRLAKGTQSMFAFVGVDAEDATGQQTLKVDVTMGNGSKVTLQDTITVLKTEWTIDYLEFTEDQIQKLLDPQVTASELGMLKAVYAGVTPEKLWSGPWLPPVQGALTARHGEQRSINGSTPSGHHGGTDFGALEGTPVIATNSGHVVLAKQLTVRGNMVVIDHGGGLYSGYAHLSVIHVKEGDLVDAGEHIADVGNTGLSTGAHLHWEMASQGVFLDALRFTDGTNGY